MLSDKKTIFALSSSPGRAATALIRISGPKAFACVKKISSNMPNKPNISTFNEIRDADGALIDQTITTFFKAPKSFTGEDVVELSTHGGGAVTNKILEIFFSDTNLKIASPGEFTRRAFENNKLDLTQVEAIADIVSAETEMQRKQAINHLSGSFSKTSKTIFENLKKILANIEAIIDFSDEDLPPNLMADIKEQIENNIRQIKKITNTANIGISIRDGFLTTVIGKPNTGKSSFINYVSGREISIVTNTPGTTRDALESFVDFNGYPIRLFDTAGIRDSSNLVERIGVKKALKLSKESNINIVFIKNKADIKFFENINNCIFLKSKQDITKKEFNDDGFYNISSKTGYGIKKIKEIIIKKLKNDLPNEKLLISRERHLVCFSQALKSLEKSKNNKNIDLFAEDIRVAIKKLSNLFGIVDIEDILDIIFSDFCIGK